MSRGGDLQVLSGCFGVNPAFMHQRYEPTSSIIGGSILQHMSIMSVFVRRLLSGDCEVSSRRVAGACGKKGAWGGGM